MQTYITIPEAAIQWRVSAQVVRRSCERHEINGALHIHKRWLIPEETIMPPTLQPYRYARRIPA